MHTGCTLDLFLHSAKKEKPQRGILWGGGGNAMETAIPTEASFALRDDTAGAVVHQGQLQSITNGFGDSGIHHEIFYTMRFHAKRNAAV